MAQLVNERPDIVVLDLKMPGMTGFELLDRIAPTLILSPVPAIVLTSAILTAGERQQLAAQLRIMSKSDCPRRRSATPSGSACPEHSRRRYKHEEINQILIVDDDGDAHIKSRVCGRGYSVCEAGLGRDALALVATENPILTFARRQAADFDGIEDFRENQIPLPGGLYNFSCLYWRRRPYGR